MTIFYDEFQLFFLSLSGIRERKRKWKEEGLPGRSSIMPDVE